MIKKSLSLALLPRADSCDVGTGPSRRQHQDQRLRHRRSDPGGAARREATVKAVRAFYDFLNTGDEALLKQAIAENFTDRTLPPGRPQGPEGPAFASRQFRVAVPDLQVTVEKMIVADNCVTVHMRFTGHFTGAFGQTQGKG
jgi:predicted ester cyclase